MSESNIIELEMGLSEKDFNSVLPNAVKPYEVTALSNGYELNDGEQQVLIEKTVLSPRAIASIRLPRMMVVLKFPDQSEQQVAEFMKRFNRYMHRGGG